MDRTKHGSFWKVGGQPVPGMCMTYCYIPRAHAFWGDLQALWSALCVFFLCFLVFLTMLPPGTRISHFDSPPLVPPPQTLPPSLRNPVVKVLLPLAESACF